MVSNVNHFLGEIMEMLLNALIRYSVSNYSIVFFLKRRFV